MSNATFSFSSTLASPLANRAWASAVRAVTEGSTTLRQTLVLERVSGARARKSIHGVRSTQSAIALALASARAIERLQAAERLRPVQRVEIVLDAQHRGGVDGLALEEAFGELAALGQAEQFRQGPRRGVGLKALGRARA